MITQYLAEFIDKLNLWRIYKSDWPEWTVAYEDDIITAMKYHNIKIVEQ